MQNLKRLLLSSLFLLGVAGLGWPGQISGGNYVITKDVIGATGSPYPASSNYSLAFAWGEPASGDLIINSTFSLISGYLGGRFGNGQALTLLSSRVGLP